MYVYTYTAAHIYTLTYIYVHSEMSITCLFIIKWQM